jgi:hypothetical protein
VVHTRRVTGSPLICPLLPPRVVTWVTLSSSKSSRRFWNRSRFQPNRAVRPLCCVFTACDVREIGSSVRLLVFAVVNKGVKQCWRPLWKRFSIHRLCSKGKYRHAREGGCFVYWLALWRHVTIMNWSVIFRFNAEWFRVLHMRSIQFGGESSFTFTLRSRLRPWTSQ